MSGSGVSINFYNLFQFGNNYDDYEYDEEEPTPKETPTRGNFPQSTATWNNPLANNFNPLNPLASNPLSNNPLGGPPATVIKPPQKAEEQLQPIKEGFKNQYI